MPNLPVRAASVASGLLLPFLLSASTAHAAPIKRRFELQLQASVLDYVGTNTKIDDTEVTTSADSTRLGLGSRLGVGFGYAFSEHAELHVLNGFSIQQTSTQVGEDGPDSELSGQRFEFLPTIRYVAGQPESTARFYIGGGLGYMGESSDDETTRTRTGLFSVTSILGLHAFLSDRVSLDPALELSFLSASTTAETDDVTVDASGTGFRALFTLGLTGWLGGRREEQPARTHEADEEREEHEEGNFSSLESTEVHLDLEGMGLTVSGAPLQNGRTLLVEVTHLASAAQWRGCDIVLGDGTQTVTARAHYRATEAGRALEEYARASVGYGELDRWARSSAPSITLCGKGVVLRGYEQQRVIRGLERFQTLALRAGTFVEEAPAQPAPPVAPKLVSDPDVFASMQAGVMRCVPNQPSVTLRFRLSGKGTLERLEPDPTRDEATSQCLAQTIMNVQFVPTGEARTLEHTFTIAAETPERSGAAPVEAPAAPETP